MSKIYTRMEKQVVNDTRLARKMYPNYVDNGDGTVTIEVEVAAEMFVDGGILTATMVQDAIDNMMSKAYIQPAEMIVSPEQFEKLQKLTAPEGVSIVESVYCPEDKIYVKKDDK